MQSIQGGSDNLLMINNRFNTRYSVAKYVGLARFGEDPHIFRTRNICHEGMFVEARHTDLQPGESLMAALYVQSAGIHVQPFTVDVVHRTDDGIGVLVSDPSLDIDLLDLINQQKTGISGAGQRHSTGATASTCSDDTAGLHVVHFGREGEGMYVTLKAGPMLDLRLMALIAFIRRFFINSCHLLLVDVDFRHTHSIMDSGLAILLLLKRSLGPRPRQIRLVNASDSIRDRLMLFLEVQNGFVID